jgi:hypothetical protein
MTAEIVTESSAKHGILMRERKNLGLFLHLLFEELDDQSSEFASEADRDFAYFEMKFPCDLGDIDICVHGSHVLVRMSRLE